MAREREYELAMLDKTKATPEMILSGALDEEIKARMDFVIKKESPIRRSLLYKRTINSFSLMKVGSRLAEKLDSIAMSIEADRIEEDGESVFIAFECSYYRPTPDSEIRYSYQIPYIEGANCLLDILENGGKASYTQKELSRLFSERMGYQKLGGKVLELFRKSLKDPRIKISKNGRVQS